MTRNFRTHPFTGGGQPTLEAEIFGLMSICVMRGLHAGVLSVLFCLSRLKLLESTPSVSFGRHFPLVLNFELRQGMKTQ